MTINNFGEQISALNLLMFSTYWQIDWGLSLHSWIWSKISSQLKLLSFPNWIKKIIYSTQKVLIIQKLTSLSLSPSLKVHLNPTTQHSLVRKTKPSGGIKTWHHIREVKTQFSWVIFRSWCKILHLVFLQFWTGYLSPSSEGGNPNDL